MSTPILTILGINNSAGTSSNISASSCAATTSNSSTTARASEGFYSSPLTVPAIACSPAISLSSILSGGSQGMTYVYDRSVSTEELAQKVAEQERVIRSYRDTLTEVRSYQETLKQVVDRLNNVCPMVMELVQKVSQENSPTQQASSTTLSSSSAASTTTQSASAIFEPIPEEERSTEQQEGDLTAHLLAPQNFNRLNILVSPPPSAHQPFTSLSVPGTPKGGTFSFSPSFSASSLRAAFSALRLNSTTNELSHSPTPVTAKA